jgi:hypothetical protein
LENPGVSSVEPLVRHVDKVLAGLDNAVSPRCSLNLHESHHNLPIFGGCDLVGKASLFRIQAR